MDKYVKWFALVAALVMAVGAYGTLEGTVEHLERVVGMYFWTVVFLLETNNKTNE